MLNSVNFSMMKQFISTASPALNKDYTEELAKELLKTLDERLDDAIYCFCTSGKKKDFSFTQNGETFSVLEIMAMRRCSYYEAVLLMDDFIKDAKTGRARIMRR